MWKNIKLKFETGELGKVTNMKVSTALDNPRAPNTTDHVVILYCNQSDNSEHKISRQKQPTILYLN